MKYSKSKGRPESSRRAMSVPKVKMKKLIKSREVTDRDRAWGHSGLLLRPSFDE